MKDCAVHGLRPSILCCPHVRDASEEALACEIADYVFDAYDNGFVVCPGCVAAAHEYVRARTDEELDACSFIYRPQCEDCIDAWVQTQADVNLDALHEEARKRARGLPPR